MPDQTDVDSWKQVRMGAGKFRFVKLMIVSLTGLLIVVACDDDTTSEATPEPTPTASPNATSTPDDEISGQPDPGEVPCEVRELEPPREDAPETDPERIEEWLKTAQSFNDVTIGDDGRFFIGSYRHAAIIVLNQQKELVDVWTEGVRNRHPQMLTHPDGRILLLQDSGLHFFESDGGHQKYLSMLDFDAEFIPNYGGLSVASNGDLYFGLERGEGLIKIDEECQVLGHWSNEDDPAPALVAVDGNDHVYAVTRGIGEATVTVRNNEDDVIDEWSIDAGEEDALTASVTGLPDGGMAKLWVIGEDETEPNAQRRAVGDFLIQFYSSDGELVREWTASKSGAPEIVAQPLGMTVEDNGATHIVDHSAGEDRMRMHTFNADGEFVDEWRLESDEELCEFGEDAARMADCDENVEPESGASPTPQPTDDDTATGEGPRDVLFELFDATDAEDYETIYNHLVSDFQRIEFDPDASERRQWVNTVAPRNMLIRREGLDHPADEPESWRVEAHDEFSVVRHREFRDFSYVFGEQDGDWRLDPGPIAFVRAFGRSLTEEEQEPLATENSFMSMPDDYRVEHEIGGVDQFPLAALLKNLLYIFTVHDGYADATFSWEIQGMPGEPIGDFSEYLADDIVIPLEELRWSLGEESGDVEVVWTNAVLEDNELRLPAMPERIIDELLEHDQLSFGSFQATLRLTGLPDDFDETDEVTLEAGSIRVGPMGDGAPAGVAEPLHVTYRFQIPMTSSTDLWSGDLPGN